MALESRLLDARGNEFLGQLDVITGTTITDARVSTATLALVGAEALWDLNGHATLNLNIRSAAANLTAVFEGTVDGTNYIAIPALNTATQAYILNVAPTTTIDVYLLLNVAGFRRVRVRCSARTSGDITVSGRATTSDAVIQVERVPMTLGIQNTGAAGAAVTLTIPLVTGLFHYLDWVRIEHFATALLVVAAAPVIVTTTNIPGTPSFNFRADAVAQGTLTEKVIQCGAPFRSSVAGTNTTIVCPATTAVIWRVSAAYRLGY